VAGHFLRRQAFHVAQHERRAFARAEQPQAILQVFPVLALQDQVLRGFPVAEGGVLDFAERGPPGAAEKIDGGVGGDAGEPVGGFLLVLELFLVLEGLDEGFLGQVLGVSNRTLTP